VRGLGEKDTCLRQRTLGEGSLSGGVHGEDPCGGPRVRRRLGLLPSGTMSGPLTFSEHVFRGVIWIPLILTPRQICLQHRST
jgi:hypothetical protein